MGYAVALEPVTCVLHLGTLQDLLDDCHAVVRVRSYAVDEGLSRLFSVVLDVDISWPEPIDLGMLRAPRTWLGRTTTFSLMRSTPQGMLDRHWVGAVAQCEVTQAAVSRSVGLRFTLAPHLQLLAHEQDSEVYIGHSAEQILAKLLTLGMGPYGAWQLVGPSSDTLRTSLEARFRHQESRLDALHRLMNDFGLGYWITCEPDAGHSDDAGHGGLRPKMYVFTRWQHLAPCLPRPKVTLPLVPEGRGAEGALRESIAALTTSEALGAKQVCVVNLDPTRTDAPEAEHKTALRLPGEEMGTVRVAKTNLRTGFNGSAFAAGLQDLRAAAWASHLVGEASAGTGAQSDALAPMPGACLTVQGALGPRPEEEEPAPRYVVTGMRHMGSDQAPMPGTQAMAYSNLLDLVPLPPQSSAESASPGNNGQEMGTKTAPPVPDWLVRLPVPDAVPLGLHSAIVLGRDANDELPFVDAAGRVLVHIHGMQHTVPDDANMTPGLWVRVAQTWAGSRIGTFFWPRPGFEVLLGFMGSSDGEPVVLGCAYNAHNAPPYNHFEAERSGFKTHGRGNELSFLDAQGREEIKIEAARTMDTTVNEMMNLQVGFKNLWRRFLAAAGTIEKHAHTHAMAHIKPEYKRSLNVIGDTAAELRTSLGKPLDTQQRTSIALKAFKKLKPIEGAIEALLPDAPPEFAAALSTAQEFVHSTAALGGQIYDLMQGRVVHKASIYGGSKTTITHDCSVEVKKDVELSAGKKLEVTAANADVQASASLLLRQKSALGPAAQVVLQDGRLEGQSMVFDIQAKQKVTIKQGGCSITLHDGQVHIRAPELLLDGDDVILKGRKSVTIKSPKTSIY